MSTGADGEVIGFASDECPIDLNYSEEQPVILDFDMMTRKGLRMRRRRTVTLISAATASIVIVSLLTWNLSSSMRAPVQPDAASAISATMTGKAFPPIGQVAILATPNPDARPVGQSVVAWATQGNQICFGSINIADPTNGPLLSCQPAPAGLMTAGPALLPDKPTFRAGPILAGHVLAIGFVRGAASSVSVTMSGSTAMGTVAPLGVGSAGAYAVWLPTSASSPIAWSAISKVVAEDASGSILASLP